jgi:cell cycle protein kinase DBF2
MAKYAEVREKQRHVDAVVERNAGVSRGVWVGFTFKAKKEADKALREKEEKVRSKERREEEEEEEGSLYTLF